MKIDTLELINNSKILNAKVEELTELPAFSSEDAGRFFLFAGVFYFNNGERYITYQKSFSDSDNTLRTTLGSIINDNFSINPAALNELFGVSGLTASSTIFDLIQIICNNINQLSTQNNSKIIESDALDTVHVIQHNLDTQFPTIQVLNKQTRNVINDCVIFLQTSNIAIIYLSEPSQIIAKVLR